MVLMLVSYTTLPACLGVWARSSCWTNCRITSTSCFKAAMWFIRECSASALPV